MRYLLLIALCLVLLPVQAAERGVLARAKEIGDTKIATPKTGCTCGVTGVCNCSGGCRCCAEE